VVEDLGRAGDVVEVLGRAGDVVEVLGRAGDIGSIVDTSAYSRGIIRLAGACAGGTTEGYHADWLG
jgi:hypothetical protein